MRNTPYQEFENHIGDVLMAGWYGIKKGYNVGVETCEIRRVPGNNVIKAGIVPSSYGRYVTDGIRRDDIIILWVDATKFIPVTFEWYNNLFIKGVNETYGERIGNWMYDHILEYMEERMRMCGLANV